MNKHADTMHILQQIDFIKLTDAKVKVKPNAGMSREELKILDLNYHRAVNRQLEYLDTSAAAEEIRAIANSVYVADDLLDTQDYFNATAYAEDGDAITHADIADEIDTEHAVFNINAEAAWRKHDAFNSDAFVAHEATQTKRRRYHDIADIVLDKFGRVKANPNRRKPVARRKPRKAQA